MKKQKPTPKPPEFPLEVQIYENRQHALNFIHNLIRDDIQFCVSYDNANRLHISYPTGPNRKA